MTELKTVNTVPVANPLLVNNVPTPAHVDLTTLNRPSKETIKDELESFYNLAKVYLAAINSDSPHGRIIVSVERWRGLFHVWAAMMKRLYGTSVDLDQTLQIITNDIAGIQQDLYDDSEDSGSLQHNPKNIGADGKLKPLIRLKGDKKCPDCGKENCEGTSSAAAKPSTHPDGWPVSVEDDPLLDHKEPPKKPIQTKTPVKPSSKKVTAIEASKPTETTKPIAIPITPTTEPGYISTITS